MAKNGNTAVATTGATSASGKVSRMRKLFVQPDGSTVRHATPDFVAWRFEIFNGRDKDGKPVVDRTVDFSRDELLEKAEDNFYRLAAHGGSQKLGDSVASISKAEDDGPDAVEQVLTDSWDNLLNGVWTEKAEGTAGNVGMLADAIMAAAPDQFEDRAALIKYLAANETEAKAARKDPRVAVELRKIEAERAAKRLEKAAEAAAKATDGEAPGLLAGFTATAVASIGEAGDEEVDAEEVDEAEVE